MYVEMLAFGNTNIGNLRSFNFTELLGTVSQACMLCFWKGQGTQAFSP